jgi:hypothetical protein
MNTITMATPLLPHTKSAYAWNRGTWITGVFKHGGEGDETGQHTGQENKACYQNRLSSGTIDEEDGDGCPEGEEDLENNGH